MALEGGACEVVGPERGVGDARLGERAVEVEHPDKSRPLPRPVGNGEDRAGVTREPGENVVGVLPDRLRDHQRRGRIDLRKHLDPLAGAGDEAVAAQFRRGVAADERPASGGEGPRQIPLHLLLGRPADLVGPLPQIATGDKDHVGCGPRGGRGLRTGGASHNAGPRRGKQTARNKAWGNRGRESSRNVVGNRGAGQTILFATTVRGTGLRGEMSPRSSPHPSIQRVSRVSWQRSRP